MTPQPTTSNRAPSLKSVTISPSVRTNGTTNYNAGTDDEPISHSQQYLLLRHLMRHQTIN